MAFYTTIQLAAKLVMTLTYQVIFLEFAPREIVLNHIPIARLVIAQQSVRNLFPKSVLFNKKVFRLTIN